MSLVNTRKLVHDGEISTALTWGFFGMKCIKKTLKSFCMVVMAHGNEALSDFGPQLLDSVF